MIIYANLGSLQTLLPVILNHAPAGTSSKTVVHYGQGIESGEFKQYDYGAKQNMEIYKSTEPPKYNISKITVPITLFCGDNDWLSSPVVCISYILIGYRYLNTGIFCYNFTFSDLGCDEIK